MKKDKGSTTPGKEGITDVIFRTVRAGTLLDYYRDKTRPATVIEVADLKQELEGLGYVLRVVSRMTAKHRAAREQAIKDMTI